MIVQTKQQEPGDTAEEILNSLHYVRPGQGFKPNFQLFAKCDVNGSRELALYSFLKASCAPPVDVFLHSDSLGSATNLVYAPLRSDDVRWNFEKFLLDRSGRVVMRFQHATEPAQIAPFVEALLRNEHIPRPK